MDLTSSFRGTAAAMRSVPPPTVRNAPAAGNGARQESPHRATEDIVAMRQRWDAHLREKRLDLYTHVWLAVIAAITVAAVGLAWLWLRA